MRRQAYLYVAGIAILAIFLILVLPWSGLKYAATDHFFGFAALIGLGILSQHSAVSFALSGSRGARSSLAFLPLFACAITFPPIVVIAVAVLVQLSTEIFMLPRIAWRTVFNVSQWVLSYGLGAVLYHWLGSQFATTADINIAAFFAMVLLCQVLNQLVVSGFVAVRHEQKFRVVLRQTVGPGGANLAYDILASPVAIFAAYLYLQHGAWGLLLVLFPLFLIRHTYQASSHLQRANADLLTVLVKTIETRDPYTSGHSVRVKTLSHTIAQDMGMSARMLTKIETAALLHDVGKIDPVYSPLICKPYDLTPEERAVIQTHATKGAELLSSLTSLPPDIVKAVRHHHEHYDGNGYPDGLAGEQIPLPARIIMAADAIDAMLSHRPYRAALSIPQVKAELLRCAGTQFDPRVVTVVTGNDTLERALALASLDEAEPSLLTNELQL